MTDDNTSRTDRTIQFTIPSNHEDEMKIILKTVFSALKEKGYNPYSQIVGYLLSEDPTYITTHNDARKLIRRIDRDELMVALVRNYVDEGGK